MTFEDFLKKIMESNDVKTFHIHVIRNKNELTITVKNQQFSVDGDTVSALTEPTGE